jgi:Rps23 Pro-64 3,4-dihydroxylase Tpa1-like proline 4-hydroxylase
MALLDLTAIRRATFTEWPYPYAVLPTIFADDAAGPLVADFPERGFRLDIRELGGHGRKRYRARNYQLVDFGRADTGHIDQLSTLWRQLVAELTGPGYRAAVAEATGTDLSATTLDIRLIRYLTDDWIEPHVDRPDKVVTQLTYFNQDWRPEWAGALRILRSADMEDYAEQVFPSAGNSVLMVRTDNAWHGVPSVRRPAPGGRCTLLVHFARPAEGAV